MARPFTAGVATGILLVGLAGVTTAALRASPTAAAGPSRTPTAAHNATSRGSGASNKASNNKRGSTVVVARASAGQRGVRVSDDWGTGLMMVRKAGGLTVTAINGQTITATFGGAGGPLMGGIEGGPVVIGKPGFGIGSVSPMTAPLPSPVSLPMTVTIDVNATTVYTRAGQAASLSDIQVGSVLQVQGTPTGNNAITASAIEIVLPERTGVVTAINGNALTVTGFDARTYTITVGNNTTYHRASQTAALSDVAVGSLISAEGTPSSDGSTLNALAVTIQLPRVFGRVTAISGDTVTVQGPDGTTYRVQLTDATTYSAGPQATAGKSSITVGSGIMAEGTLGSDGTLTALHVDVATGFGSDGKGMSFRIGPLPGPGAISGSGADATTSTGPSF